VTKVWPRSQFPMRPVGELVLNRNPEDYHRDVEQAAFSPGSLVPGVELSPDSLLQWRAFFYRDAQYHRLGSANIHQIPVNCPFMAQCVPSFVLSAHRRLIVDEGSTLRTTLRATCASTGIRGQVLNCGPVRV
jgi:catalase